MILKFNHRIDDANLLNQAIAVALTKSKCRYFTDDFHICLTKELMSRFMAAMDGAYGIPPEKLDGTKTIEYLGCPLEIGEDNCVMAYLEFGQVERVLISLSPRPPQ